MSKHLPECHRWFANMPEDGCPACEMFRACEQRVLDAAREAVDGLDKYHHGQISAADAIADIEALRRESDV